MRECGKEVILIPKRQTKTERHERKTGIDRNLPRHKQRETDERDWKRKRAGREEREMGEGDGRGSKIQYKSPRSNLNVYHLN